MRFVHLAGHTALFAASGWFWWDFARHVVELASTPQGVLAIAATVILPGIGFLLAPNKWDLRKRPITPLTSGLRLVWSRPGKRRKAPPRSTIWGSRRCPADCG